MALEGTPEFTVSEVPSDDVSEVLSEDLLEQLSELIGCIGLSELIKEKEQDSPLEPTDAEAVLKKEAENKIFLFRKQEEEKIQALFTTYGIPEKVGDRMLTQHLHTAARIQSHCEYAVRAINAAAEQGIPFIEPIDSLGLDWVNRRTQELNHTLFNAIVGKTDALIVNAQQRSHPDWVLPSESPKRKTSKPF